MDPLTTGFLAVGATLLGAGGGPAALILNEQRFLRTEIGAVEIRLGERPDALRGEVKEVETRLGSRIDRLGDRVTGFDSRLSRVGGALPAVLGPFRRTPVPERTPDESPV